MATSTDYLRRIGDWLEALPSREWCLGVLCALVTVLFLIANVPWHLDNYDQAKQAYVAFEIDQSGNWLLQTTPAGRSASKPPLMGWMSAGLMFLGIPWDLAVRLPSMAAAFGVAALLGLAGWRTFGRVGCVVAIAAFSLNLLTPRIASLVRTDMLLAFFIFVPGWIIYGKLRQPAPWTSGERWAFGCAMLGALLTKGPVIYAFLLPGLIACAFLLRDGGLRRMLWSGWLAWVLPLVVFVGWGIAGLLGEPSFYQDVVQRELLSRFQDGTRSDERPQPFWFYFPHLIHKLAPWSLLVAGAFALSKSLRGALRQRPELLWCLLWVAGGLLVMTIIPAKRVDRIYPIVPPLALLAVEIVAVLYSQRRMRVVVGASVVLAAAFSGGYFLGLVPLSFAERSGELVKFAHEVDRVRHAHPEVPLHLVRSRDEGLLIYLRTPRFLSTSEFERTWESGEQGLFLVSDRMQERYADQLDGIAPILDVKLERKNESGYRLISRKPLEGSE